MVRAGALLTVGLFGLTALTAACAAENEQESLWELSIGGYGRYGQSYPGSEDSQTDIIPLPFPVYRGKILRVGDETDKPV